MLDRNERLLSPEPKRDDAGDQKIHRWTGQRDLCIGAPVAGRGRTEVESLIGLFVNTLVLRLGLAARYLR